MINKFEYRKLSKEELELRGILGRLVGKIAAWKAPTRNGRIYKKELWQKALNDEIFQEKLQNKCIYGELQHPVDREETDPEKIAVCLAETPTIADDGFVYGVFDIINSSCGKILKTMLDYGTTIGISSRGSGDLYTDSFGQETVDPDTYNLLTWDCVFVPACKEARLLYVTESLNTNKLGLLESLAELVDNADDSEKLVMQETIASLENTVLSEDTDYYALIKDVRAAKLSSKYSKIQNKVELRDAIDLAIEANDTADIKALAKLIVKYDPEFVKVNPNILELAKESTDSSDNSLKTEDFHQEDLTEDKLLLTEFEDSDEDKVDELEVTNEDTEFSLKSVVDELYTELINDVEDDVDYEEKLSAVVKELYNNDEDFKSVIDQIQQSESSDDIDTSIDELESEDLSEVENNEAGLVSTLLEALIAKKASEARVLELNKKLSVCYAKEKKLSSMIASLNETLNKQYTKVGSLRKEQNALSSLKLSLITQANKKIDTLNSECKSVVDKYNLLAESYNELQKTNTALNEELKNNAKTIRDLNSQIKNSAAETLALNESLKSIESSRNDLTELVEKYKNIAKVAVNKYIDSLALKFDIASADIKRQLGKNYSFNDIDRICESLSSAKVNINSLPFVNSAQFNKKVSVELAKPAAVKPIRESINIDDQIDSDLKLLAKL